MATGLEMELERELANEHDEAEDITAEELSAIRAIRRRAKGRQHTPYRKALIARVTARSRGMSAEAAAEKFPLPDGRYWTYRLAAGRHERYDADALAEARKATQENRKQFGADGPVVNPVKHVFTPGDLVTPQDDQEALLMDQDQNKFRPVGPDGASDEVDVLQAEVARLRAGQARADDLDRREAELRAQQAELDKAKAELARGGKGGKG